MTSRIDYNNPTSAGKLGLPYHYEMVFDSKRLTPFKLAIQATCKNKRVFESGIGSGIMSILAAKAGAKKIYATEIDPSIADFAQENINKNGFQDIIKIIIKDTRKVSLEDIGGERVDVAIAENLSTLEVNEPEIAVFNHINKNLVKTDGIRIPERILNNFELANSQFRFEDSVELRTYFFEFSGISSPKILSGKILFSEIDLRKINPTKIEKSVTVEILKDGIINSIRLTSPLKVFKNITFNSSDSLMPPVVIPLREDIAVSVGSKVKVTFKYSFENGWNNFVADVISL